MNDPIRAALERLVELDQQRAWHEWGPAWAAARAALAQPKPEVMGEPPAELVEQWLAQAMRSVSGASQALLLPRGLTGLIAGEVARLAFAAGTAAAADHVPVVKESLTTAPPVEGEVAAADHVPGARKMVGAAPAAEGEVGERLPDWRGLCEELANYLQGRKDDEVGWPGEDLEQDLLDHVHALLAQPEPEVVGPMQLPEQSPDEHPPSNLDRREVAAWYHGHGCGWQAARAVLARWGRPAPAPDDRGVLPMIVSKTGADDEPELERIICASISGGADYVNNMPRALSLERITPDGSTFARYIQADADTHLDVRPAQALPPPSGEVQP